MRGHDPDALTPREQEVLDLLKRGYSNRDIAQELQISLSGAKYHVSEIISKLGVSSREEAAGLAPHRRIWGLLSPAGLLSGFRQALSLLLTTKSAALVLLLVLAGTAAVGAYVAFRGVPGADSSGPSIGGVSGAQLMRISEQCESLFTYQCIQSDSVDYSTLEEALGHASFKPAMPDYIPEGFQPVVIRVTRPTWFREDVESGSFEKGCPGCDPRLSHNDQLGVYYRDGEGRQLAVVQGAPAYFPLHQNAAEGRYGDVRLGEYEAFWVEGVPLMAPDLDQLMVYWDVGRIEVGSEDILPHNDYVVGSPFSYSITATGLSLEELVKIAESVSFD